jgi:hypothetical protein
VDFALHGLVRKSVNFRRFEEKLSDRELEALFDGFSERKGVLNFPDPPKIAKPQPTSLKVNYWKYQKQRDPGGPRNLAFAWFTVAKDTSFAPRRPLDNVIPGCRAS